MKEQMCPWSHRKLPSFLATFISRLAVGGRSKKVQFNSQQRENPNHTNIYISGLYICPGMQKMPNNNQAFFLRSQRAIVVLCVCVGGAKEGGG